MKSRIIDPLFFKDEFVGELEPLAMVTFIGLWCLADREGRLEDRPKWINAELFPYSNVITCDDIERQLMTLATVHPFIHRYTVDGKRFIQITNFTKHQHVHPHERRSIIPKCTDVITCHAMSGALTSTSTYTSPLPPAEKKPKRTAAAKPDPEREAWFAEWYSGYPRKLKPKAAKAAFMKRVTSRELFDKVMDGMRRKVGGLDNTHGFEPYPATWINEDDWKDTPGSLLAQPEQPAWDFMAYLKAEREGN